MHAAGTLLEYHGGSADLAAQRPMLATTPMMAYSMSKTITAAAVLQLVEAGRVALDDPITRHVDAQPYGGEITVRQLLSHTSGIPNPLPLKWVHPAAAHASFDEAAALARVLDDHPKLASRPGARYRYLEHRLLAARPRCRTRERDAVHPLRERTSAAAAGSP